MYCLQLLSRKFMLCYNLASDLLSKADHYDWKLRAVKTTLGCLLLLGALLTTIKNTRMGPNSRFLRKRCFPEFFPVPRSHACLDLSLGHLRKLSHLRGRFGPTFDRATLEALIVIRKCRQTGIFCRNRFFETTKLYCRDVYHSSKLWGTFENSVT